MGQILPFYCGATQTHLIAMVDGCTGKVNHFRNPAT